ncbi:hypothetical protein L1887_15999 [Cichorium endivia]|nr:hypothetical protein L1887_15999 [Cichorium endivia]
MASTDIKKGVGIGPEKSRGRSLNHLSLYEDSLSSYSNSCRFRGYKSSCSLLKIQSIMGFNGGFQIFHPSLLR